MNAIRFFTGQQTDWNSLMDLTEMAMLARWLKIPLVNGFAAGIFMCTCRLVTGRQGRLSRKIYLNNTRGIIIIMLYDVYVTT